MRLLERCSLMSPCLAPRGLAGSLTILVCIGLVIDRVNFEAFSSSQKGVEWLSGAEASDPISFFSAKPSPELARPKDLTSHAPENRGSDLNSSSEFADIEAPLHIATEPAAAIVRTAPRAPEVADGSSFDGDEHANAEKNSSTTIEDGADAGDSIDWDTGWGEIDLDQIASSPIEEESGKDNVGQEEFQLVPTASTKWVYDVCLLVSTGRKPNIDRPALPYGELYRLFNAAKGAPNGTEPWSSLSERKLYVGGDFSTILCLMVSDELGPSVECSNYNKFGVKTNHCKHLVVGETKRYSPQPSWDDFRRYGFLWNTVEIVNLDVEDPARNPPILPESQWRPTIVTAFSSNKAEVGLLMLRSLGKVAAEQTEFNVSVVVYTLNRFPAIARRVLLCVINELQTVYKVPAEIRQFDFDAWPSWMHLNQTLSPNAGSGEYAWKAIIMHTVLLERGFVYWANAGDRFRSANGLTSTLRHLERKGFTSRMSGGRVKDTTHVRQLEYFGANRRPITVMPNCDTSGIGFTLDRYKQLARPWYECCITRQCIAPEGSNPMNHRQDQSALTVLAAFSRDSCEGVAFDVVKQIDHSPKHYLIGVNATQCYKDPLHLRWR
ncbi:uncharacterized protein [Physcomitrium patens]|uniref:Uncharacterized protein n=1 Tax=Physcomitrium patens TaxID=3218 RepID=A0A2K1IY97_PHYPA|nr:uncharacterized protein LOC112295851 [Physcomitrium patens]PNR34246.1 hypothetical protein PHYPA_024063 [Physcomitrium patens]|eukprot:XP_024403622.1 uncharacterized protein LOC112295851 [Physcomitrella patens]